MTDQPSNLRLVEELRLYANGPYERMLNQAADEIERVERWAEAWHRLVESIATILDVSPNGGLIEVSLDITDAIRRLRLLRAELQECQCFIENARATDHDAASLLVQRSTAKWMLDRIRYALAGSPAETIPKE